MPYKDREKAREATRNWRERSIKAGYGKALYARRAQRLRNEEVLREAVSRAILDLAASRPDLAMKTLTLALEAAPSPGPPKEYMPDPNEEIASGLES